MECVCNPKYSALGRRKENKKITERTRKSRRHSMPLEVPSTSLISHHVGINDNSKNRNSKFDDLRFNVFNTFLFTLLPRFSHWRSWLLLLIPGWFVRQKEIDRIPRLELFNQKETNRLWVQKKKSHESHALGRAWKRSLYLSCKL